jgi:exodeoxyribonuclease V alpha subunit
MPVMITKNDYENMVFNGDRGIIIFEELIPYLLLEDSRHGIRKIPFTLVKNWEISYSQTVHKSQGNEYNSVLLVIETNNSMILTRELLYTAVTRAKKEVILFCNNSTIKEIAKRKVIRNSSIGSFMLSQT